MRELDISPESEHWLFAERRDQRKSQMAMGESRSCHPLPLFRDERHTLGAAYVWKSSQQS